MYAEAINHHQWKKIQNTLYYSNMIIKMAKRLKLDPKKFAYTHNNQQGWIGSPFPALVISLYEKRFGKVRYKKLC